MDGKLAACTLAEEKSKDCDLRSFSLASKRNNLAANVLSLRIQGTLTTALKREPVKNPGLPSSGDWERKLHDGTDRNWLGSRSE